MEKETEAERNKRVQSHTASKKESVGLGRVPFALTGHCADGFVW